MTARHTRHLCAILAPMLAAVAVFSQPSPTGRRQHWNEPRGYAGFCHERPDGLSIECNGPVNVTDSVILEEPYADFTLRFMASNKNNHPAKSYPYDDGKGRTKRKKHPEWGFYVKGANAEKIVFRIKTEEVADILSSSSVMMVKASGNDDFLPETTAEVRDCADCHTGLNLWQLKVKDGKALLSVGNRSLHDIMEIPVTLGDTREFGFIASPGANLHVRDISIEDTSPLQNLMQTEWNDDGLLLDHLQSSTDPLEGYWAVFDRTLEESLLQLGGDYHMAIVRDDDRYVIIYLSGARIGSGLWRGGMVKGYLTPGLFPGIYDVTWIDAKGMPMSHSIKAQAEDGDLLSIQFPYQSSVIRLRKAPLPQE